MKPFTISLFLLMSSLSGSVAQNPTIQAILDEVEIDSMIYYASAISGEFPIVVNGSQVTIASRHKNDPGNALSADYFEAKMNEFGLSTAIQSWSATGENVIATQPGLLYPNQKVVLCAHYDAIPTGVAPAADDDGSGTAALIEAARIMSQYQFVYTIEYCFWDEEEQGKVGSLEYAQDAAGNGDSIIGVVNMDAIAWDGDGDGLMRIHTRDEANSEDIADIAVSMNTDYNLGLDIAINNPGATYSDHASFWTYDYGAILIIEDFDNDGNPHYHTPTDLVQYFDTLYFEKLAKLAFATTGALAIPYTGPNSIYHLTEDQISTHPTPILDQVYFDLPAGSWTLEVVGIDGKTVLTARVFNGAADLVELETGVYLGKLTNSENRSVKSVKLVKK